MRIGPPILLFLLAVLPRAIRPVSRPLVWYLRSAYFIEDVLGGNWASTVYSEHPGVTLMWSAGIGLKLYWALSGITPAAHAVPSDLEPIHFFGPVPLVEISATLVPLALLIALSIVGTYLMLRRLFDEATAAVAGLLLALSPYYLAQSKILHLDAPMATLMLLSALALLVYRRERRRRWLLLSGAVGGLALLTKIPAVFLVPFCGLVLLADIVLDRQQVPPFEFRVERDSLPRLVLPLMLWLIAAVVVYSVLWPVMWVDPGQGLAAVRWGITRHATTAHDSPTLFLGQVVQEDPGPLFYPVSLLFRTSEVVLVFLAIAAIFGITRLARHRRLSGSGLDYLLLLAYAAFYLAQMSLGAKKMPRYILPSLLVLVVLAAAGVVAWARELAGGHHRVKLALMALPILAQAVLTLPRHPYYGTALNWIAGGPPAAARAILIGEEGEGYVELTTYLNAQPDAARLTVAAQLKHVFNQTFQGTTVEIDQRPADYLAFHRNYTARDYKVGEWGRLWERYGPRTPEREVSFDGVPYAWLYPTLGRDTPPENEQQVRLGDRFRFLGYDLRQTDAAPGDTIPMVLYWQATEGVTDDLSIFVHLLDPTGQIVWQDDGAANHGDRPTWTWRAGEVISDPHTIELPSDLSEDDYLLVTGLYDWQTGVRLPAPTLEAERESGDEVVVATLAVRHPQVPLEVWLARTLGGLTLLSALIARLLPIPPILALNHPSRYN
ncbi:MAG: glycosyltransferase family 39 protein [Chloroflexota bacterium]|nr:glycosyltransferase family 39 protein [Chloroflexota bacterium]